MWLGGLFSSAAAEEQPIGTKLNSVFGEGLGRKNSPKGSAAHVQPQLQQIVVTSPPAPAQPAGQPTAPVMQQAAPQATQAAAPAKVPIPAPAQVPLPAPAKAPATAPPARPQPAAAAAPISLSAAPRIDDNPRQPLLAADSAKEEQAEAELAAAKEAEAARIIEKAARKRMTTNGTVGGRKPVGAIAAKRQVLEDEAEGGQVSVLTLAMLGCVFACCCLFLFGAVGGSAAVAEDANALAKLQHTVHEVEEHMHLIPSD